MRFVALVAALSFALTSCESTTTQIGKTGPGDASAPTGSGNVADAGVACGATRCGATDLCVYPACGCVVERKPPTSSGGCPDGAVFDESLGCYLPPHCQDPYCAPPPSNGQSVDCSGQDGTFSGPLDGPVPAGASHVCHYSCA